MTTIPAWFGIVCHRPGGVNVQRLVQAFVSCGARARPLRPADVDSPIDTPAAVVCRLPSGTPSADLRLLAACRRPLIWVNRPSVLGRVHDKLRALDTLAEAGLPVPPTVCVRRDVISVLDDLPGDRFVVKPATGAGGHGVSTGWTRADALARARAFAELSGPVLVQPLLGGGLDRRLFVAGRRVVAAMERVPSTPGGRGSTRYGALARAWTPRPDDIALALRAAAVLELDVAGVDLVGEVGRRTLLEVNACPGWQAIEDATGEDVAGAVARLALERAGLR